MLNQRFSRLRVLRRESKEIGGKIKIIHDCSWAIVFLWKEGGVGRPGE